jgi:cobalamin biosynthesis protein CbiG
MYNLVRAAERETAVTVADAYDSYLVPLSEGSLGSRELAGSQSGMTARGR